MKLPENEGGIETPEVSKFEQPEKETIQEVVVNKDTTLTFERRIGKNSEFKSIKFDVEKIDSVIKHIESNNFKLCKK